MHGKDVNTEVLGTQQRDVKIVVLPINAGSGVPALIRLDAVKRIAGQLDAAAALLEAMSSLPESGHADRLKTCAVLAVNATRDLAALVGGAA